MNQVSYIKVSSKLSYLPEALKLLFEAVRDSSILLFANQFCSTTHSGSWFILTLLKYILWAMHGNCKSMP